MHINVKLMGWMREFLADGIPHFDDENFELPAEFTLAQLIERFGFERETPFMVMRNGERVLNAAFATTTLHDEDRIVFVPPLKGG